MALGLLAPSVWHRATLVRVPCSKKRPLCLIRPRSNRLARAYQELGVTQGSLVTVALPNSVEFYEAAVAAWKLGACPLPLSPKATLPEQRRIAGLAD